jgi:hypothetical protein
MRGVLRLFGLFFGLISTPVLAANVICVMRMNVSADPCERNLPQFAHVIEREKAGSFICTRRYEDKFCKYNKGEFYHALGRDGSSVCVMNFKQELIGNPCSRSPQQYGYAIEPW